MNTLLALCPIGSERALGCELKKLGFKTIDTRKGRVSFLAENQGIYKALINLALADRIYLLVARYSAGDFGDLFDGAYRGNWQDLLHRGTRVVVDKVRGKGKLQSQTSVQSVVHKAIYSKLCAEYKLSSWPETSGAATIRVYMEGDEVLLCLDLTGESLYKRGYRLDGGIAPLRETVARTMLQLGLWRRKTPLLDPFCGSGTIAIEAWLYAHNIASGLFRHFAIESLKIASPEHERLEREEAIKSIKNSVTMSIKASDINSSAIKIATENLERAKSLVTNCYRQYTGQDITFNKDEVDFEVRDFATLKGSEGEGLLLANPPYGKRLGTGEEAKELYEKMRGLFKCYPNYHKVIITTDRDFPTLVGAATTRTHAIKAGPLDAFLYFFAP